VHVLVVCTGNICRSPTAERLLRLHAGELGVTGLTVGSAGTRAVVGYGMEATAREVLVELGGDPVQFRARQLTPSLVEEADLVLTMTTRHRDRVLAESPRAMRRTFTVLEAERLLTVPTEEPALPARLVVARGLQPLEPHDDDVVDPVGEARVLFETVGQQINRATRALAQALAEHPTRS
jgi:protein-tyrosine phosphatase